MGRDQALSLSCLDGCLLHRRENLNALCMRLGWGSRRAKRLGSPSELISWLGRLSSFWSVINPCLVMLICGLLVSALQRYSLLMNTT